MSTQAKTGARAPQTTAPSQTKQSQKLPIKAAINWMNPNEDDNVRASASLTIGGAFAVHGIKIVSGTKGDFVSMPSYKSGDGYRDIFHAITADDRERMNAAVMQAYEQMLADEQDNDPVADAHDESAQAEGPSLKM
jgi:stage V sporulation protein G